MMASRIAPLLITSLIFSLTGCIESAQVAAPSSTGDAGDTGGGGVNVGADASELEEDTRPEPKCEGLVAYWAFEQEGAVAQFNNVVANSPTSMGPAEVHSLTGTVDTFEGRVGRAVALRGSQFLKVDGAAGDFELDEGTIAFWVWRDEAIGAVPLSRDAVGDGAGHLRIAVGFDGGWSMRLQGASGEAEIFTDGPPNQINNWVRVIATFGEDGMKLFVATDGVQKGTQDDNWTGGIAGNDEPLVLGGDTMQSAPGTASPVSQQLQGLLDEVMIFDRVLSRSELERSAKACREASFGPEG